MSIGGSRINVQWRHLPQSFSVFRSNFFFLPLQIVSYSLLWKQRTLLRLEWRSVLTLKWKAKTADVDGELAEALYINIGFVVQECVWCLASRSQASLFYFWYKIKWIPPVGRSNTDVIDQNSNVQVLLQIIYFGFCPRIIPVISIDIINIAVTTTTTSILNTILTTTIRRFSLHI